MYYFYNGKNLTKQKCVVGGQHKSGVWDRMKSLSLRVLNVYFTIAIES